MKKTLGMLIQEVIEEKKVSRTNLCRGLCSVSALSKYLSGGRRMDRLLATALMQRLGLSPDKFTTLLTEGEYRYFDWRQRIASARIERDWEKMEHLLQEDAAEETSCNQALREQFRLLLCAEVAKQLSGDRSGSLSLAAEAVRKTMPGLTGELKGNMLFSMQEISALLFWVDGQPGREMAEKVLDFLEHYIPVHYSEEREVVKLYPKVAARHLPILFGRGKYTECFSLAERAMEMIVSSGYASSIETVLDYYVRAAERLGMEKDACRKKTQLEAWRELMGELGEIQDDELYMMDVWQEVDLLDEVLRRNRQYQGYSQAELSEGICTPENLSRIESGRHVPNTDTFYALSKKLLLQEDYYYSDIETDDLSLMDRKWQIEKMIMNHAWKDAKKTLKELETKLDLSNGCNRQYVRRQEYILECREERLPVEARFSTARDILSITVAGVPKEQDIRIWPEEFWTQPFCHGEIKVLMQMADALVREGRAEQGGFLLKKLLGHYESSRVKLEFHFRNVILIIERLSFISGMLGQYEECLKYSEEGIRLCLVSGTRTSLPVFICTKADALEHFDKKEASLKYYRLAVYAAELFNEDKIAMGARRSCKKLTSE